MLTEYYRFARSNSPLLIFGLITAFFGNYGQSFFIAWFGESFLQAFNLTNAEYGMAYSGATLVSGFIIMYAGGLLDRTPLKTFTLATSAGLAAACFILYAASEFWHLVLALFLLRFCGQGLMFHIAFTTMARYFFNNRGKAIGIVGFGMPLGEAILPALAVALIAGIGWRETWLLLGLTLPILFWPAVHALLKQAKDRLEANAPEVDASQNGNSDQVAQTQWTRAQVVKDFRFWILLPVVMAPAFIVTGIFIHQGVLLETKNWSGGWFAICFTVYAATHLAGSLVIGSLVDKYSGKQLIQFYLLPMALGLILLALPWTSPLFAAAFMALTGITIGASGPIVGSLWVEMYGNRYIGAIRSTVTALMVVSTAISPVLLGWLFDHGHSFENVMTYLLIYMAIGWALMNAFVLKKSA